MFPKPVVDYRTFRLSKLNQPEFSHLKLLGGWIGYFILYFLTENLIPEERFHVIHCAIDDLIPFNEYFLLFYCFWYAWIVISLLYFMLYDIESFRNLQIFIIITQVVAMMIYIAWPSIQLLRPEVFPRDNALTALMRFIYAFDTPTGVCPSLHVAYSMGIMSVWLKYRPRALSGGDVSARGENADRNPDDGSLSARAGKLLAAWKVFNVISFILVSISTAFVKQHSVVDIIAALPLGILAELIVYRRRYFRARSH